MADEIQGLWIGSRLSAFERLCIRSFQDHGHSFRLFTYGPLEGVPDGTLIEDGNAVLPRELLAPFQAPGGALAHFADWFRWELLRTRGGWWVDMDMVCLAPFDFSEEVVFGYQDPFTPNVSVLRFPAEHPMAARMAERCAEPARLRPGDSLRTKARKILRRITGRTHSGLQWGEAGGPVGFREELQGSGYENFGQPFTVFYPVHHQHWPCIFDETLKDDLGFYERTVGLHLWNELFRKFSALGHDADFPAASIIEQLKRKHLPGD